MNQLKVHWSRLKSSITDFNDAWTKVTQMHTSGYSSDIRHMKAGLESIFHWCIGGR
jgi:hypothetical protein